jgi:hypothetical protein
MRDWIYTAPLCGRIGHKRIHCTAPLEEKFPEKFSVSLHVNIFSNLLPISPLLKTNSSIAITKTLSSTSQTRLFEPTQPSEASLILVPNTQTLLAQTRPMQQKISHTFVMSFPTSPSLNDSNFILTTASALDTLSNSTSSPTTPHQSHNIPTPQPQQLFPSKPHYLLALNQNSPGQSTQAQPSLSTITGPTSQAQPSLTINLPFSPITPITTPSSFDCIFSQIALTNPQKFPPKNLQTLPKKPTTQKTLFSLLVSTSL